MAGTQALDASRTPAFSCLPQNLLLVTEKGKPFFSRTVFDEVPDTDVLDAAVRGILTSIRVRRTSEGSIVTAGRQRTKRALIVNHLTGVAPYTGSIPAVIDAIARLRGTSLGDRIVEIANRKWGTDGVMIRAFAANSGTDTDEETNGLVEDEIRRGGSGSDWSIRAERAQALIEGGHPIETVAASMRDVTVPTLKRWIAKLSAGAPAVKEKIIRGPSMRPKAKEIRKLFTPAIVCDMLPRERAIVKFFMGSLPKEELLIDVPELASEVEAE